MDDLARLIDRTSSASVGISGMRGIGKSTLIRWLCTERNACGLLPALGIYVTAPVEYDARDFLVHLYITLCKTVLADDRFTDHRARQHRSLWRAALVIALAAAGTGAYYHHAVDREVTARWAHDHGYLWSVAASALFAGALFALASGVIGMRRRRGGGRRKASLEATARDRLRHLRYQVVETTGQAGSLTGPFGLSFSGSRSRQVTENQMTLPELVESYREFAGLTVSALQEAARRDGPLAVARSGSSSESTRSTGSRTPRTRRSSSTTSRPSSASPTASTSRPSPPTRWPTSNGGSSAREPPSTPPSTP